MMKHNDFRKGGMVSVWVGSFHSDIELDDYLNMSRKFEQDFGFELSEGDMPETSVLPQPVPVSNLVHGFSWSDAYAQSVTELARNQGIARATTMVIFLNFAYDPDRAKPRHGAPLRFLGTVRFS